MYNSISKFYIDNDEYSIILTYHARERMIQRTITEEEIIENVVSISLPEFRYLRNNSYEAIIINREAEVSVVLGFDRERNNVTVITAIDTGDPYSRADTVVIYI